ncbi:MAG: flagellar hook-length control protein FliK [Sphingomonadaceae bacterium]
MNVSHSSSAVSTGVGVTAKPGKSGDPLADFMALLTQLGISVSPDGTIENGGTVPATPENQDAAAKLLAKLAKQIKDGTAEAVPDTGIPNVDSVHPTSGKEKARKGDESITTLTDLLAKLSPDAGSSTDPAKLDIAALMAALQAFAETKTSPQTDATPSSDNAAQVVPAATSSIAALLARVTQAAGKEAPVLPGSAPTETPTPGAVQSAFAKLETVIRTSPDRSENAATPANDEAPVQASPDMPVTSKATRQLAELIARLSDSSSPGVAAKQADNSVAAVVSAQGPQTGASPAPASATAAAAAAPAAVHLASLAKADEKPVQGIADAASNSPPTLGLAPLTAPTASGRIDIAQANPAMAPAEEMISHHLDLAHDTQWLDSLARDIARAAHSDSPLRFQLNPEHLGSLKVELLNGSNGTSVKLTTESEAARAILADAQPRLVAEARAQGLRISEAQVHLGGQGGGHRPTPDATVVIRTAGGAGLAEVELERSAGSGERYA